jgi:hypothetical protein
MAASTDLYSAFTSMSIEQLSTESGMQSMIDGIVDKIMAMIQPIMDEIMGMFDGMDFSGLDGLDGGTGSGSGSGSTSGSGDVQLVGSGTGGGGNYPYKAEIEAASRKHGVPVSVIRGVIKQESGGNPTIRSPAGAVGLMQLMPGTARELGVTDRTNPAQNIDGGTRYLKQQYQKFGSWELAFAAYNAGPGAVQKYNGIPPYEETQNYVRKVSANVRAFGGIPSSVAA